MYQTLSISIGVMASAYLVSKKYKMWTIFKTNCASNSFQMAMVHKEKKEFDDMKRYYNIAVFFGCSYSMLSFAEYYHTVEKDYENAKKYYHMSVDNGNTYAMIDLGYYYQTIETDYEKAKKYYHMANEHNHYAAPIYLGSYYEIVENDYEKTKQYYFEAIDDYSDKIAMTNLGYYYERVEHDYEKAKKYYVMAIEHGNFNTIAMFNGMIKDYDLINYKQYLSQENTKKLNDMMKTYHIIKNANETVYEKEECVVCYENKEYLDLHCGHKVCYMCYDKIEKCPLCRKII